MGMREKQRKNLLNYIQRAENYISFLAIPMLTDLKTVWKGRFGPKSGFSLKAWMTNLLPICLKLTIFELTKLT